MNVVLDVRGLEPPEPFERTMEALADLTPDQVLTLRLDRVPYPLFRILDRDACRYDWRDDGADGVTVRITPPGVELPEEE